MKRGIVKVCINEALSRYYGHEVATSFTSQIERLKQLGCPLKLSTNDADCILADVKIKKLGAAQPDGPWLKNLAVILYMHKICHNLKKVLNRTGVRLPFTPLNNIRSLCQRIISDTGDEISCRKEIMDTLLSAVITLFIEFFVLAMLHKRGAD